VRVYGGYAVDWLIGHTDRFKAAVSHDGVFNLETMSLESEELWFPDWESGGPPTSAAARKHFARCSPHLFAGNIKTPTLVITNEQDFRVPVDQGLQLFTALRRNGVPSQAMVFPDEGHWFLGALQQQAMARNGVRVDEEDIYDAKHRNFASRRDGDLYCCIREETADASVHWVSEGRSASRENARGTGRAG
jgi:dienelactone hydrolase